MDEKAVPPRAGAVRGTAEEKDRRAGCTPILKTLVSGQIAPVTIATLPCSSIHFLHIISDLLKIKYIFIDIFYLYNFIIY